METFTFRIVKVGSAFTWEKLNASGGVVDTGVHFDTEEDAKKAAEDFGAVWDGEDKEVKDEEVKKYKLLKDWKGKVDGAKRAATYDAGDEIEVTEDVGAQLVADGVAELVEA